MAFGAGLLACAFTREPRADGYTSCLTVTGYGRLVLREFDYDGNPTETFLSEQAKERCSMYAQGPLA